MDRNADQSETELDEQLRYWSYLSRGYKLLFAAFGVLFLMAIPHEPSPVKWALLVPVAAAVVAGLWQLRLAIRAYRAQMALQRQRHAQEGNAPRTERSG